MALDRFGASPRRTTACHKLVACMVSAASQCHGSMTRIIHRPILFSLVAIRAMASMADAVDSQTVAYEAHGTLKDLDWPKHQAIVSHDAIPGYMPAMTMTFDVRDKETGGLHSGDPISFRLCIKGDDAWIEHLQRVSGADSPPFSAKTPGPSHELREGDLLPDIDLVDQEGRAMKLSTFRGKSLALTFIYTRCPLPTYCPLISRNFESAQSLLAKLGELQNARFLSVSLDPSHDSPESLSTYAKIYHAEGGDWIFATSSEDALRKIGATIGLESSVTEGRIDHNLRTAVIDSDGRLRHVFRGNAWTPQELAAELRSATRRRRR